MKKISAFILTAFLLLAFCGCSQNIHNDKTGGSFTNIDGGTDGTGTSETSGKAVSSESRETEWKAPEAPEITGGLDDAAFRCGAEDAERLGVNKVVTWVSVGAPLIENGIHAFNELLVNTYGCDFVVEFINLISTVQIFNYDKYIYDAVGYGQQIDILNAGVRNYYTEFVNNGMYIPLNDYIATEEGQKLYESYPKEIWDMVKRNGNIYGYLSKPTPGGRSCLFCNNDNAVKYGIDVESIKDGFSFYDLEEILENASISADDRTIVPIYSFSGCIMNLMGFEDMFIEKDYFGIFVRKDSEGNRAALNICEDEEFIRLCKTVRKYREKGWLYSAADEDNNKSSYMKTGKYIFYICDVFDSELVGDKLLEGGSGVVKTVSVGDIKYMPKIKIENCVNGVCAHSDHAEEALKVITLVNTEEGLANVLYLGVEGVDYTYDDDVRKITPIEGHKIYRFPIEGALMYSNVNLLRPVGFEPDNKLEYNKELSSHFEDGVSILYDIDISGYEERLFRITKIYNKYSAVLLSGYSADVEGTVRQMGEEFEKEGMNEIIDYLNRQMEEQRKSR